LSEFDDLAVLRTRLWHEQFGEYERTGLALPLKLALEQQRSLYHLPVMNLREGMELHAVVPFLMLALNEDDQAVAFIKVFASHINNDITITANKYVLRFREVIT